MTGIHHNIAFRISWLSLIGRRHLNGLQQSWPDPAGRNIILINLCVPLYRLFHISNLVLLGDEFSGFVEFKKLFCDFNKLAACTWLCR